MAGTIALVGRQIDWLLGSARSSYIGVVQMRFEVVKAPRYRLREVACGETSADPQTMLLTALRVQQTTWRIWYCSSARNLDDTSITSLI